MGRLEWREEVKEQGRGNRYDGLLEEAWRRGVEERRRRGRRDRHNTPIARMTNRKHSEHVTSNRSWSAWWCSSGVQPWAHSVLSPSVLLSLPPFPPLPTTLPPSSYHPPTLPLISPPLCFPLPCQRSYHVQCTASGSISDVKQHFSNPKRQL